MLSPPRLRDFGSGQRRRPSVRPAAMRRPTCSMKAWKRSCADARGRRLIGFRQRRGDGELVADEERQAFEEDLLSRSMRPSCVGHAVEPDLEQIVEFLRPAARRDRRAAHRRRWRISTCLAWPRAHQAARSVRRRDRGDGGASSGHPQKSGRRSSSGSRCGSPSFIAWARPIAPSRADGPSRVLSAATSISSSRAKIEVGSALAAASDPLFGQAGMALLLEPAFVLDLAGLTVDRRPRGEHADRAPDPLQSSGRAAGRSRIAVLGQTGAGSTRPMKLRSS